MKEIRGAGPKSSRTLILVDFPRVSALANSAPLGDWEYRFIYDKLRRVGISPGDVRFESFYHHIGENANGRAQAFERLVSRVNDLPNCKTIITLGEHALRAVTDKSNLDKWHASPLNALPQLSVRKVVPTFHPEQIMRDWIKHVWVEHAFNKVKKHQTGSEWPEYNDRFLLSPSFDQTLEVLKELKEKPVLGFDIETGKSQINTVGFSWSKNEAIAIRTLPREYSDGEHYELWSLIRDILEGPPKILMQNGIYETMYLGMYGIRINEYYHDTMWAQKFLWPELEKGLDSVGRIYTMRPYWKDEGKAVAGEGKKKDWANIRDWHAHLTYNCKDSAGTFEAYQNQIEDMKQRGIYELWNKFIRRFTDPLQEMCMRGMPVNEEKRKALEDTVEKEIETLTSNISEPINPRSSKQKLELFRKKEYQIPKSRNPNTKKWVPSTNELSLKKMRLKYPGDEDIKILIELSHKMKALSAYIQCAYDEDGFVRYMYDGHGTETGRFSSSQDHRRRGFNIQTLPTYAKRFIEWPADSDRQFICCDLRQAESRFVAYDSADIDLIKMLEDPSKDIHKYVAAEIFQKPETDIVKSERQLGKKSGHGANYSMKEGTFMESCLKEMDLVLTKKEATNVLESYHRLFPGIRRWHSEIRNEVRTKRMLTNPLGRQRYFYGRVNDDLFREAYAYRPQSTVPDITNHLMLALYDFRKEGLFDFWFHAQVHDSVVVSAKGKNIEKIARFMLDLSRWHPVIDLKAGRLKIPTEVEIGRNLGETEVYSI